MVEIQTERGDAVYIFTERKYKEQIKKFIEENYGKIVLEECHISDEPLQNIQIKFPSGAVGLDVLICFIGDLEYDDLDLT